MNTRNKYVGEKSAPQKTFEESSSASLSQDKFEALLNKICEVNENVAGIKTAVSMIEHKIDSLTNRLEAVQKTCDQNTLSIRKINFSIDGLEQYSRRNNLRFFGIGEHKNEDTDALVLAVISSKLGVNVSVDDIDRSHRVGRMNADDKPRAIIVKFVSYRTRALVFNSKKKLKASGISIKEDLTTFRLSLLKKATSVYGMGKVWSADGKIFWTEVVNGMPRRKTDGIEALYNRLHSAQ